METNPRILIVDDEKAIADLVSTLLAAEGMEAQACYSSAHALEMLAARPFDVLILDIMMPGMDGFELARKVRAFSDMPLIFLSAKDDEVDKVVGFALGADDYVSKPFKPRELVARVKARLRRRGGAGEANGSSILRARGIEMDTNAHTASLHGQPLRFTPKEFETLALLIRENGRPVSSQRIFETVWGERFDDAAGNTVMVHIRHLRKKLAAIDASETFIETAWGVGYKVAAQPKGAR